MDYVTLLAWIAILFSAIALVWTLNLKWRGQRLSDDHLTPQGRDESGDLTPGAKQAVRDYLTGLLAPAGAIIAIVAGVGGFMINELAKETALSKAFTQIQSPLLDQIRQVESANSIAKLAAAEVQELKDDVENLSKIVQKEEFVVDVVARLSNDTDLQRRIQDRLVSEVANELVERHADALRGDPGKDGESPDIDAVAAALARQFGLGVESEPENDGGVGVDPRITTP